MDKPSKTTIDKISGTLTLICLTDCHLTPTDEKKDTHTLRTGGPGTAKGYNVGASCTKLGEMEPDLIH